MLIMPLGVTQLLFFTFIHVFLVLILLLSLLPSYLLFLPSLPFFFFFQFNTIWKKKKMRPLGSIPRSKRFWNFESIEIQSSSMNAKFKNKKEKSWWIIRCSQRKPFPFSPLWLSHMHPFILSIFYPLPIVGSL